MTVPEGAGTAVKSQQSLTHQSPTKKVQAHMLLTSQRTSDSDEELVYERVKIVQAWETHHLNRSSQSRSRCQIRSRSRIVRE